MKFGLRAKLFLVTFGLIGLCVAILYGYARRATEREAREGIQEDLLIRLALVVTEAESAQLSSADDWDTLADRLGRAAESRVTFVAPDGDVLGDSVVGDEALAVIENHRSRPEIQRALSGEIGQSERFSDTARVPMIYVAAPVRSGGEIRAAARLALSTEQVDKALGSLQDALAWASVLALGVALVVTFVAAQVATRPVRALTRAARLMAGGDLQVRARVPGASEFAELGQALDLLAKNLSTTLGDLREERDRMSAILSSMEEGVLFLDEEGRVALVNPALRDMLLLRSDSSGRSLLEVVRHAELKELLDAAADDEEDGPVQGEIRVSGLKPRHLFVRARKLEGLASGVVATFLDVTETRRLENLRREFVSNVSHELRTPVTSIRSAAETLEGALATRPEMAPRFVEIIDRNAARLHQLVEDLLDLSRIESRQFSLTLDALSPTTVMAQIAGLFSERAARRSTEMVLEVPEDLPEIRADRRALEHVLSNLVDNAVKYAGEGKRIVLGARADGDMVELVVSDNGPGIESRHLPRLFERFYRVDAGRSRDLGGTGLGLSIVKHLVESMSGKVTVESEVGSGTTFRVRLPSIVRSPGRVGGALLN